VIRGRRGFGLAELLMAMVIAGIIGVALTRLVISQARFVGMQDAMMRARSGARASLNVLSDEMKMVPTRGVRMAHAESIEVRVPYAFGIACFAWSGYMILSLLPSDSATFFGATPSGYAWRNASGIWQTVDGGTIITAAANNACSAVGISGMTTANWVERYAGIQPYAAAIDTGTAIMLYQRIKYAFAPSVLLPGRVALWRTVVTTGVREELVAPFDTASRFEFLTTSRYIPQSAVPASLDSIRGVRVRLKAASETTPQGRSTPPTFDISVDVYFRNYEP